MQDNQQRSLTSDDLQLDEGVVHQGDAGSIVPEEEVKSTDWHWEESGRDLNCIMIGSLVTKPRQAFMFY